MSQIDARAVIDRAKRALGLKSDLELAKAIDVPRETVASWKSRGSIPAKYLAYMASTGLSIDWLLTGNGNEFTSTELGLPHSDEYGLDWEALWIALILMARDLRENQNGWCREFAEKIGRRECMQMHLALERFYPIVMKSKNMWKKTGLLKEEDTFKALAVEFDLGDFDFHSPPWWEDEELT